MNSSSALRHVSAILFTLSFAQVDLLAQFQVRANGYLAREHTQTSADTPAATGEYRFVLDSTGGSDFVQYIPPTGLRYSGANRVFEDLEALHAQFPGGTYTAQLDRSARPGRPASSHTLQADFPSDPVIPNAVPHITNTEWNDGVLLVDPNFTLTIEQWEGRPPDSMIRLQLQGPGGGFTYTFSNQDRTSFTINGDGGYELLPNSTYQAVLTFVDPFASVSTPIPGMSPISQDEFRFTLGSANSVSFTIVTVPEPRVSAILAAAAFLYLGICKRRSLSS